MDQTLFKEKRFMFTMAGTLFTVLAAVGLIFGVAQLKELKYIGAGVNATNTISVSASGEVFAVPDVAYVTFSHVHQGKTVADAQKGLNEKIKAAVDAIKALGIDEKDIKTESINSNPQYDYGTKPCPYGYCPQSNPTIIGYEASQSIQVKIRNTDNTGKVVEALGKAGITSINGPEFGIDDEDTLKDQAREKAIAKAQVKADKLAKELGVSLVRIVSFSEDNGGYMYVGRAMALDSKGGEAASPAPTIPTGENKITSNVSITYEIR